MVDLNSLKEEQIKLSKKVVTKDSFDKIELVAGADFAYDKEKCICAIVVCDFEAMEAKEKVFSKGKLDFQYARGFLGYRLAGIITETYLKLKTNPDIVIFPGHGISHPRRFGLASQMGVSLDVASIGVAKKMLHGEEKGGIVYSDNEARAQIVATREKANPLYISPGHRISLKTSIEIVKKCMRFPHKLPEPLHMAHRYAKSLIDK